MRKALSLILALVTLLSLCACGSNSTNATESTKVNALPKELSQYFGEWTWESNIYPSNYAEYTVTIEASGLGSVHGVEGTWHYEQPDGLSFYVTTAEGEEVSVAFFDFIESALDGNAYLYGNVFAEDAMHQYGIESFGTETVKGQLYKDSPEYRYNCAIYKLNQLVADSQIPVSLTQEDAQYLIDEFTALGDYKDSQQLLSHFSVSENVLTSITNSGIDNLGNQVERTLAWYEYDHNGHIISGYGDFLHEEYGVYNSMGGCIYRYDDTGKLTEVLVMTGTMIDLRGTPTYDENDNLISMKIATNYYESTATFEYDEQNRRIKTQMPNDEGQKMITYTYDDSGRLVHKDEEQIGGVNFTLSTDYEYVNDQLTKRIAVKTRTDKSYTYTYTYTYNNDSNGNPITVDITTDDPNYLKNLIWTYHYTTLYYYIPAN